MDFIYALLGCIAWRIKNPLLSQIMTQKQLNTFLQSNFAYEWLRLPMLTSCPTDNMIYIIISKNIRYLLWNRGARRFFHGTYLTIEVQGIRCTNHLHDSCPLTDVNPHLTAPGCRYYLKIGLLWRHWHMGQPLAIVTSQWFIVPTGIYGRMMLRSTRVKGIASTRRERWLGSGGWKVEIIQTINS